MKFDLARKIADAVLYEGYVLYPYRASAIKNRFRWQFGVVAPRCWSETGGEPWEMQTECLLEARGAPVVDVQVRFLQIRLRTATEPAEPWEEGVERTIDLPGVRVDELETGGLSRPFGMPGGSSEEYGVVRELWPVSGLLRLQSERLDQFLKLRIRIENLTEFPDAGTADRAEAIRHALVGTHTLLAVEGGAFLSLTDPPAEAGAAAMSCANLHTWPVLVGVEGMRDVMLSSPIILHDYPAVAPESPGDLFDATEIDEILTLRIMTLTDEEKREALSTDERARRIIERSDAIPQEVFERLHGALRSVEKPAVRVGARVRLAPRRRADSMDLFLAGRIARVAAIERDLENRVYVAVAVEDDPAADLNGSYNRFFYFDPDELELVQGKEP